MSNDLESAARVPDRDAVLLVESGDGGDRPGAGSADPDAGIYYATFDDTSVEVVSYTKWPGTPEPLDNVEATAVAAAGDLLYFLYAERASGQDQTTIHWTILEIADDGTLSFGTEWGSMPFTRPGPQGARPASSLEVGADGRIFVGSAFDADDDNGPFASAVWEVGTWTTDGDPRIAPRPEPAGVGHANGFKIESIATSADGDEIVFVGVDDENYGGTLRPLLSEADTEGV